MTSEHGGARPGAGRPRKPREQLSAVYRRRLERAERESPYEWLERREAECGARPPEWPDQLYCPSLDEFLELDLFRYIRPDDQQEARAEWERLFGAEWRLLHGYGRARADDLARVLGGEPADYQRRQVKPRDEARLRAVALIRERRREHERD